MREGEAIEVEVEHEDMITQARGLTQGLVDSGTTLHGKLMFVDLAGSERLKKTGAEGTLFITTESSSLAPLSLVTPAPPSTTAMVRPWKLSKLGFGLASRLSMERAS